MKKIIGGSQHLVGGKTHYERNKKKYLARIINRKKNIFNIIWEYKKNHSCVDCGNSNPIVIDFDHLGNKFKSISVMVACGYSIDRILKEISKCETVCSNCHRIRTFKRNNGSVVKQTSQ